MHDVNFAPFSILHPSIHPSILPYIHTYIPSLVHTFGCALHVPCIISTIYTLQPSNYPSRSALSMSVVSFSHTYMHSLIHALSMHYHMRARVGGFALTYSPIKHHHADCINALLETNIYPSVWMGIHSLHIADTTWAHSERTLHTTVDACGTYSIKIALPHTSK